jgi:hypothetical protein
MDKLEEHIRRNRKDFDKHHPSSDNWKKIELTLRKSRNPLFKWYSIAAMVLAISGIASIIYFSVNSELPRNSERTRETLLFKGNPELKETQLYYDNLVNSLYKKATPMLMGEPELARELKNDISQIDSIYADIKNDLRDNIANQDVIEALIQNYRIKIRLLEEMLILLNQNENDQNKNTSHEL